MSRSDSTNGNPGRYFLTRPTLNDGESTALATDSLGRLLLATEIAATVGGTYALTPPTLSDGTESAFLMDNLGNLKVTLATQVRGEDFTNNLLGTAARPVAGSQYGYTPKFGFTATTYQTVKAAAGALRSVIVTNANAAVRFLLLTNTASAPSGATGVLASIPIPAGTVVAPGMLIIPSSVLDNMYFSTGVTVSVSTADGTFTAATAAEHTVNTWSI